VSHAAGVQATEQAKPILEDLVANQPMLDEIVIQELDLGPLPLRLAGIKVYDTKDDEVIMEAPVQWGSAVKVHSIGHAFLVEPHMLAQFSPFCSYLLLARATRCKIDGCIPLLVSARFVSAYHG
jgi:hypothetical protein